MTARTVRARSSRAGDEIGQAVAEAGGRRWPRCLRSAKRARAKRSARAAWAPVSPPRSNASPAESTCVRAVPACPRKIVSSALPSARMSGCCWLNTPNRPSASSPAMAPGPAKRANTSVISVCSARCASAGIADRASAQLATSSRPIAPASSPRTCASARRAKSSRLSIVETGGGRVGKRPSVKQSRPLLLGRARPDTTIRVLSASDSRRISGGRRPRTEVVDKARSRAAESPLLNRRRM